MELDEPQPMVQIDSEDNKNFQIKLVPNLAQHTLVTGPRYTHDTLKIMAADQLGNNTSGVMSTSRNFYTRKNHQETKNLFILFSTWHKRGFSKGLSVAERGTDTNISFDWAIRPIYGNKFRWFVDYIKVHV